MIRSQRATWAVIAAGAAGGIALLLIKKPSFCCKRRAEDAEREDEARLAKLEGTRQSLIAPYFREKLPSFVVECLEAAVEHLQSCECIKWSFTASSMMAAYAFNRLQSPYLTEVFANEPHSFVINYLVVSLVPSFFSVLQSEATSHRRLLRAAQVQSTGAGKYFDLVNSASVLKSAAIIGVRVLKMLACGFMFTHTKSSNDMQLWAGAALGALSVAGYALEAMAEYPVGPQDEEDAEDVLAFVGRKVALATVVGAAFQWAAWQAESLRGVGAGLLVPVDRKTMAWNTASIFLQSWLFQLTI